MRIFARHLQALDPATEIPPEDVLSRRQWRIPPYLYSPEEITALMSAAGSLQPAMRAATWRTLIGLLAVTGMRQGEACRLGRDDVDLDDRDAHDPRLQVRQVPAWCSCTRPRSPRCAPMSRPATRRSRAGGGHVPRQQPRRAAGQAQHPQDVRHAGHGGGHPGPARAARPEAARPAARIHRRDPAGLVPRRRGRPGPAPGPVHLARPRRPEVNVLVPPGRPRAPRPGSRPARAGGPGQAGGP